MDSVWWHGLIGGHIGLIRQWETKRRSWPWYLIVCFDFEQGYRVVHRINLVSWRTCFACVLLLLQGEQNSFHETTLPIFHSDSLLRSYYKCIILAKSLQQHVHINFVLLKQLFAEVQFTSICISVTTISRQALHAGPVLVTVSPDCSTIYCFTKAFSSKICDKTSFRHASASRAAIIGFFRGNKSLDVSVNAGCVRIFPGPKSYFGDFFLGGSSSTSLMPRTQTRVSQRASASLFRNLRSSRDARRRLRHGRWRSLSRQAKNAFLSVHWAL